MFIRICSNDFRLTFDTNLNLKLMTCKLITSAFMNKHVALHNTVSPIFTGQDWPVKMGLICCHKTSLNYYESELRNIPEERKSRLLLLHILKWEIEKERDLRDLCKYSDKECMSACFWYELLKHNSPHGLIFPSLVPSSFFNFYSISLYIITSASTASLCTLLLQVLLHLSVYCYFRFYCNLLCIITFSSTSSLCTLLLQVLLHPSVYCYFRFCCIPLYIVTSCSTATPCA
jgi:hypothetical protein